jgi:aryl-alcohol dehydrogenase-like predicted oxidoreductase
VAPGRRRCSEPGHSPGGAGTATPERPSTLMTLTRAVKAVPGAAEPRAPRARASACPAGSARGLPPGGIVIVVAGMRYRPLGTSGLMVSVVGLGCNNFGSRCDLERSRAVVDAALEEGVTLFDTADTYGGTRSEAYLGEILEGRRDDVILATKFGHDLGGAAGADWGARGSRRYVRRAVEDSLRRLRTDHIDLYQYHRPDGVTPFEETLSVLDDLVKEGKVLYVGSSNLSAWQVAHCEWLARTNGTIRFVSAQNSYSLVDRRAESELVPACEHYGVGLLPYFPLANGLLTGKYRRGEPVPEGARLAGRAIDDRSMEVVDSLEKLGAEIGRSLLELAVGGLAARPAVASVIAGATTPGQVRANAAAGSWVPSPEEASAIDAASRLPARR